MEENEGTQTCQNCNRDIPAVNFIIHSLHCTRNIKICPVCKEPVPSSELEEHNDRLHQLVPCKQCGERARGTDMEDHIRDSCAFTLQTCRYCSLDIRRGEMPPHERYCGARTERCADCGEYVMLRYRQLHLDSNHGFLRLDDDSPPRFRTEGSGGSASSRPPANSRPRFPPFPITDLIRPNSNRHESLRLIAEGRDRQGENDTSRLTGEEIRFNLLDSLGIRLPDAEDQLRGQARSRGSSLRDVMIRQSAVARNAIRANAARQNGMGLDGIRRNIFRQNGVAARNAAGPDLLGQNGIGFDGIRRSIFGQNVARNAVTPDVVEAVDHDSVRRNILGSNVIVARDTTASNTAGSHVVTSGAVGQNVPDAVRPDVVAADVSQDAVEQNVESNREMQGSMAPDLLGGEVGKRDANAVKAREALTGQAESEDVIEAPQSRQSPSSRPRSNYRVILKRTNDQPQINTAVTAQDKVVKKLGTRGAVKKRPAPAAPASPLAPVPVAAPKPSPVPVAAPKSSPVQPAAPKPSPAPNPRRDLPYYSALQRRQDEDRRRQEQNAYNLSLGLAPVLDPAAKLEKLRKMAALQNHEGEAPDWRQRLQGRVWRDNNNAPAGRALGRGAADTAKTLGARDVDSAPPQQAGEAGQQQEQQQQQRRRQLGELQPMSAEQFMERFNELQLIKEPRDIRSSLRELRRGLNEVTAPYNNSTSSNNNNNTNKNNNIIESSINEILREAGVPDTLELDEARALEPSERSPEAEVMVPCEFCCEPLRAMDILDHERACRGERAVSRARPPSPWDDDIPVIPCEFCTETLPFYLINEHQELCGRESQLLYPD